MTRHFNRLAVVAVLVALAALSWWLPNALTPRSGLFDSESRHEPDYIIENFIATEMNAQGLRKHELRAAKLEHYADDDSADLTQPYLIQFPPDAAPVHTRADRGRVSPDGKEILMQGNVRVTRGASGADPAGEVQTREMRVILE
ncbi:MAG TPA: LPS export ABC transporter periplasmic protein LptC [Acidiferrobacterales bacterium]|nr:LPS export ABC transporter periplasmic protein LptC [Acidiferrobacterales bacterium]